MQLYVNFFNIPIPTYGLLIAVGVIMANIVAMYVLKKTQQDFNDFIIMEAYCILGAFIGAKVLYFIVSFREIEWDRINDILDLNELMQSGFVFYGGLIGGLIFVCMAGKLHKIEWKNYIRNFIFIIPFIHSFGRVGCFMAGCCYGMPYEGPGAVVFPEESYALAGVKLFPVQLVEAGVLMLISITILFLQLRRKWYYTIEVYFIAYGIARFVLEYFRYDEIRGAVGWYTTSQWISIFLIIGALALIICRCRKEIR